MNTALETKLPLKLINKVSPERAFVLLTRSELFWDCFKERIADMPNAKLTVVSLPLMVIVLSFIAVGCGSGLHVGRVAMSSMPTSPPSENTARVVFVRPKTGGGVHAISVWNGNDLVAFVRGGQKAFIDLSAGHHVFLGVAENGDILEADLLPGKTYYVHCRFVSFYVGSAVHLDPVYPGHENWDQLNNWLERSTLVEIIPVDEAPWTQRHASDNTRRINRYQDRDPTRKKYILPEYGI